MKDKWLIFDVDRSLASIGNVSFIEKMAGFPPIEINGGLEQIKNLVTQLFKAKKRKITNPLLQQEIVTDELEFFLRDNAVQLGLTGLFIDSYTHACDQTRESIRRDMKANKRGNQVLDLAEWGEYANIVIEKTILFTSLPIPFVMTCHIDYDTSTPSRPIQVPGIKGSSKYTITQYFDIVLFADVIMKDGKRRYVWHTTPTDTLPYAKHRGPSIIDEAGNVQGLLPDICYHNLKEIIEIYRANGMPNPKILLCADSGGGKTHALKTLFDPETTLTGQPIKKGQ